MSWASGSDLLECIVISIEKHLEDDVDEEILKDLYVDIIKAFEHADCDTIEECRDISEALDAAIDEVYPEWKEQYE